MDDCILITGNKKDFCDDKGDLHPDLQRDSKRFKVYSSTKELFEKEKKIAKCIEEMEQHEKQMELEEFASYIDEMDISNWLVDNEELLDDLVDYIENRVVKGIDLDYSEMNIESIESFKAEVMIDEVVITGEAQVKITSEMWFEIEKEMIGHNETCLRVTFSFTVDSDKKINQFETEHIKVLSTNNQFSNPFWSDFFKTL